MKLSQILFAQHVGRMIRYNWYAHGRVRIEDTKTKEYLLSKGITVKDPNKVTKEPPKPRVCVRELLKDVVHFSLPQTKTEHPDWHDRACLCYNDNDVFTDGLHQAQLLTKTLVFDDSSICSPSSVNADSNVHEIAKRIVETSNIFDAHQEKLPKRKVAEKPMWVFPNDYGITQYRKGKYLCKKFVSLCDNLCGPQIIKERSILDDAMVWVPFEKDFDIYKFSLTMDMAVMSEQPLKPLIPLEKSSEYENIQLPDIHPMHFSIGLTPENQYKFTDAFPITNDYQKNNVHTIFLYYDDQKVQNFTQLPVTENQKLARVMTKAFTVAAGAARLKYGKDVKDLPSPITVQCIETDSQLFHFSIYQLNTLDIDSQFGLRNYWWNSPRIPLYGKAGYYDGRPLLEDYNPEVFNKILSFYKNT